MEKFPKAPPGGGGGEGAALPFRNDLRPSKKMPKNDTYGKDPALKIIRGECAKLKAIFEVLLHLYLKCKSARTLISQQNGVM